MLNGPKTVRSNSWSMLVVWGDRQRTWIFSLAASSNSPRVSWEEWPSSSSSWARSGPHCFRKTSRNHFSPNSSVIQPFSWNANTVPAGASPTLRPSSEAEVFAFTITMGTIFSPATFTHAIIVMFVLFSEYLLTIFLAPFCDIALTEIRVNLTNLKKCAKCLCYDRVQYWRAYYYEGCQVMTSGLSVSLKMSFWLETHK